MTSERQETALQGCNAFDQPAEAGQDKMATMAMFVVKRTRWKTYPTGRRRGRNRDTP